jgi:hypothetical protein
MAVMDVTRKQLPPEDRPDDAALAGGPSKLLQERFEMARYTSSG